MVFEAAPRSAASMSRNSSISVSSAGLRAMRNRRSARLLQELVRRYGDGDLARMIGDEIGEREHRAIADPGDQADENQESEKARHRFKPAAAAKVCVPVGRALAAHGLEALHVVSRTGLWNRAPQGARIA